MLYAAADDTVLSEKIKYQSERGNDSLTGTGLARRGG